MKVSLRKGLSWEDTVDGQTRRQVCDNLDWWRYEAHDAYQRLEKRQTWLNDPKIIKESAARSVSAAMGINRQCNNNVQELMELLMKFKW